MNARQELFCREHVRRGMDGVAAYIAVYNPPNPARAKTVVSNLLARPEIAARIAELSSELAREVTFCGADVLRHWAEIATADVNEIVRVRALACRHCWGTDHNYQWTDKSEHVRKLAAWQDLGGEGEPPGDEGGYGFRPDRGPHAGCTRCHGDGERDIWLADTGKLQGAARRLYAGAKMGKYGIEVLTRDQDAALKHFGMAVGLLKAAKSATPTAPPGQTLLPAMPIDPVEASKIYAEFIGKM